MSRARLFSFVSAACVAVIALVPGAALGANTLYASPEGKGSVCTEKEPCQVVKANQVALNGDNVVLTPGTYDLTAPGGLDIEKPISIGGAVGAAASTVLVTGESSVRMEAGTKPTLHDVRIEGGGGLSEASGTVERAFVSFTGKTSSGCRVTAGATMVDSVCWTHDGGAAASSAIQAEANGGGKGTVTLRNVTAIAADKQAVGIYANASGAGAALTVDGVNVIAKGREHPDVEALLSGGGVSNHVNLSHSNYATIEQNAPAQTVTDPATNGNQAAAPLFVNAATGDFHELPGSPTVAAGLLDPLNGTLDLDGQSRAGHTCAGSEFTDIGAYELAPAACPPNNKFRFGKQKLNKKKGTATLIAVVPEPGTLKLTGKGLKTKQLTAKSAGNVKLSIVPVGKAKKRLAKTGKRKVAPKVTFTPTGGSPFSMAHSMTLRKKVG